MFFDVTAAPFALRLCRWLVGHGSLGQTPPVAGGLGLLPRAEVWRGWGDLAVVFKCTEGLGAEGSKSPFKFQDPSGGGGLLISCPKRGNHAQKATLQIILAHIRQNIQRRLCLQMGYVKRASVSDWFPFKHTHRCPPTETLNQNSCAWKLAGKSNHEISAQPARNVV